MIDQRDEGAATFAAGRAELLLEEGDLDGASVWRPILAARCGLCNSSEFLRRGPPPTRVSRYHVAAGVLSESVRWQAIFPVPLLVDTRAFSSGAERLFFEAAIRHRAFAKRLLCV